MRLTQSIKIEVKKGEEKGIITLRQPTNQELNDFFSERFARSDKGELKNNVVDVRAEFFDDLFMEAEGLEDEDGKPIDRDTMDRIPAAWKSVIVNKEFEDFSVSRKN